MSTVPALVAPPASANPVAAFVRTLIGRQRTLVVFAAVLLVAMLPAAIALGLDDRVLRGVNVWIKPMKFMFSIGVFALTTAWFIGHLPAARRTSRAVKTVVGMIVLGGGFEAVYITLQAALGQASHFNNADALHAVMYILMGIGALVLTGSQPVLAWQLYRHRDPSLAGPYRTAVLLGLVLTFVLGAGVGLVLSNVQPPTGPHLPLLGWSTVGGDLRPAHFVGIHAQQLLPLAGALIAATGARHGATWVKAGAALYALFCIALVVQAFAGLPFIAL